MIPTPMPASPLAAAPLAAAPALNGAAPAPAAASLPHPLAPAPAPAVQAPLPPLPPSPLSAAVLTEEKRVPVRGPWFVWPCCDGRDWVLGGALMIDRLTRHM